MGHGVPQSPLLHIKSNPHHIILVGFVIMRLTTGEFRISCRTGED
jgi:hypothetical protein